MDTTQQMHSLYRHIATHIRLLFIIRDLEPGPGCLPPLIAKKRCRPKTIRIRKQKRDIEKEDAVLKFVV